MEHASAFCVLIYLVCFYSDDSINMYEIDKSDIGFFGAKWNLCITKTKGSFDCSNFRCYKHYVVWATHDSIIIPIIILSCYETKQRRDALFHERIVKMGKKKVSLYVSEWTTRGNWRTMTKHTSYDWIYMLVFTAFNMLFICHVMPRILRGEW